MNSKYIVEMDDCRSYVVYAKSEEEAFSKMVQTAIDAYTEIFSVKKV